jgi:hypothetical protein
MKATIIKIALNPGRDNCSNEYPGWIVDGTEDLLAIDERESATEYDAANWVITHIPTGCGVVRFPYTIASTRDEAAAIALRFYHECSSRNVDLKSKDPKVIQNGVNSLPKEDRQRFWQRIGACDESVESSGSAS